MKRRGLVGALLLVALTNVIVLVGVTRNRARVEATLELTERELTLVGRDREDTGIALRLSWQLEQPWDERGWFDGERLDAIGFDTSVNVEDLEDDDAPRHYRDRLDRRAFVVYEMDGGAWTRWRDSQERDHRENVERMRKAGREEDAVARAEKQHAWSLAYASRVFAVDAGPDARALRARHPDRSRYVILPSSVGIAARSRRDPDTGELVDRWLQGVVHGPLVQRLHVPPASRSVFEPLFEGATRSRPVVPVSPSGDDEAPRGPRYEMTVSWGARDEPWITSAETILGAASEPRPGSATEPVPRSTTTDHEGPEGDES